jgi:hypothetical protein
LFVGVNLVIDTGCFERYHAADSRPDHANHCFISNADSPLAAVDVVQSTCTSTGDTPCSCQDPASSLGVIGVVIDVIIVIAISTSSNIRAARIALCNLYDRITKTAQSSTQLGDVRAHGIGVSWRVDLASLLEPKHLAATATNCSIGLSATDVHGVARIHTAIALFASSRHISSPNYFASIRITT